MLGSAAIPTTFNTAKAASVIATAAMVFATMRYARDTQCSNGIDNAAKVLLHLGYQLQRENQMSWITSGPTFAETIATIEELEDLLYGNPWDTTE